MRRISIKVIDEAGLSLYAPNGSVLGKTDCFDPALTLDCGQAFRWSQKKDSVWHGVAFGRPLDIVKTDDGFIFNTSNADDFKDIWQDYFDFGRDYIALFNEFSQDKNLNEAVTVCRGIRVLRQEPWEALCSFIISQNNNIPRIKGIISRLCEGFGDSLGNSDYAFPSADKIAGLDEKALSPLRCGFRAKYILDAARKVSNGEVRLDALTEMPIDDAREELMKIKGVGPKVAECTLLYGCGRIDAFPVDVWVRRVMDELYPDGLPACAEGCRGIAQQYLFHWRRSRPKR